MPRQLILASASPRRRELLALLGLPFEVIPGATEEEGTGERAPQRLVESLARAKAEAVFLPLYNAHDEYGASRPDDDLIVLGADTIVVFERAEHPLVFNKPADANDARRMLSLLSGATHTVYTGLCLLHTEWRWIEEGVFGRWETSAQAAVVDTQVTFRALTPAMIEAYLTTGEPFDKAGAYGIQGFASAFVETIYGDYFNVVGLPVCTVARMLEAVGVEWWRGAAALE